MNRSRLACAAPLLALAAALAGCSHEGNDTGATTPAASGKSPAALLEEATVLIGSDEFDKALPQFDAVLAHSKSTAEEKASAWQGKVVCEGHVHGDDAAIAALDQLAASKVELSASQYAKMGNDLSDAGKNGPALKVIEVATEKFKGDENTRKLLGRVAKNLRKKLEAAGDTAGIAKLKSLGYVGGDGD
jgi:hypothetical protein